MDSTLARNCLTNAKICIWALWGVRWRVRERFGVQNGGETLRLGCKMEGPGAVWGAKWRVRERSESTVAGTAHSALDTPRQA